MIVDNPVVLSPPARRFIPPEVISHIFSSIARTVPDDHKGWRIRNATLSAVALVSKEFASAAYHELYGDLRLEWVGWRRNALLAAFEANPNLHSMVRSVVVYFLSWTAWNERWDDSAESCALIDVARKRWPTAERHGWGSKTHTRMIEFLRAGRMEAIRTVGEPGWAVEDIEGAAETADEIAERSDADSDFSFWVWMAENSRVTRLDARHFEHAIPDPVNPDQQLQHVRMGGTVFGLVPHLNNVQTLTLGPSSDNPIAFRAVEEQRRCQAAATTNAPAVGPLDHLKKLQSSSTGGVVDTFLHLFSMPHLVALRINAEECNLDQLARSLPTLTSLCSLYLEWETADIPDAPAPPRFLKALSRAPLLRHLSFNLWPTLELLSSLPSTVELLHINIDGNLDSLDPNNILFRSDDEDVERRKAHMGELLSRLAEVGGWKVGFAPALRAVRIESRVVGHWKGQMEARVKESVGFEGVLDEPSWDAVLPAAWRIGD